MSSPTTICSDVDERLLFPRCEEDWELEEVAKEEAFERFVWVSKMHGGKKCLPSMDTPPGHCMVCEFHTGDPYFVWRQLMIINANRKVD